MHFLEHCRAKRRECVRRRSSTKLGQQTEAGRYLERLPSFWLRQEAFATDSRSGLGIHKRKSIDVNKPDSPVTFRAPPEVRAAYDAAAAKAGLPLGRWIQDQCTAALPASVRKSLPMPRGPGRPANP